MSASKKRRKNGADSAVENTLSEHSCPFGRCTYSADTRSSLEAHIRAKHLRSPTTPKETGGEGGPQKSDDTADLEDELKRLKLQKKIDELTDNDKEDPLKVAERALALKTIQQASSNQQNQPQMHDGRVAELERVVEQLTTRYQLSELEKDFESRVSALRSEVAQLKHLSRRPTERTPTTDELQSQIDMLSLKEGFSLLSKSIDRFGMRLEKADFSDQFKPWLTEIVRRKVQSGDGGERVKKPSITGDDLILQIDAKLREKYGRDYDSSIVSESEINQLADSLSGKKRLAPPGHRPVHVFTKEGVEVEEV